MLHGNPGAFQLPERLHTDLQIELGISFRDRRVADVRLDALLSLWQIRNQQQCPVGDLIGKGGDEEGCRFHVDANAPGSTQVTLKLLVVFPDPTIRGVDGARVVVLVVGDNRMGNRLLELKRRQCRNLTGIIAVGCALGPNGGDGQNKVPHSSLCFSPPHLPGGDRLRLDGRQQVTNRGRIREPMPKFMTVIPSEEVAVCIGFERPWTSVFSLRANSST